MVLLIASLVLGHLTCVAAAICYWGFKVHRELQQINSLMRVNHRRRIHADCQPPIITKVEVPTPNNLTVINSAVKKDA